MVDPTGLGQRQFVTLKVRGRDDDACQKLTGWEFMFEPDERLTSRGIVMPEALCKIDRNGKCCVECRNANGVAILFSEQLVGKLCPQEVISTDEAAKQLGQLAADTGAYLLGGEVLTIQAHKRIGENEERLQERDKATEAK